MPLRGREHPEVRQMGVSADLRRQSRPRCPRQVARHRQSGAPEEGEGRGCHPPVADRQQFGDPRHVLLRQQGERVGPLGADGELGMAGPRYLRPRRLPSCHSLVACQRRSRCRCRRGRRRLPLPRRRGRAGHRLLLDVDRARPSPLGGGSSADRARGRAEAVVPPTRPCERLRPSRRRRRRRAASLPARWRGWWRSGSPRSP
jgi:hypothetical protein